MKKAVLVICDGLGDLPIKGKTPLQRARVPNLNRAAAGGITGLMHTIGRGIVPGSDTAHIQLFGYDPEVCYLGRGPYEALGVGMQLREGDVAFRANFSTMEKGEITDRRAGRIATSEAHELAGALEGIKIGDVEVIFKASVEHRGALVLRGPGLSPAVTDTDPHALGKIWQSRPLEQTATAQKTARTVNQATQIIRQRLAEHPLNRKREKEGKKPANVILLRGPGQYKEVESLESHYGLKCACVAGGALYKGIAAWAGMKIIEVPGATGDKNTDLDAKVKAVLNALKENDFVFLHIKACDSFSHDGDWQGKTKFIGKIDKALGPLLKSGAYVLVTGDHSTPCVVKDHSADPCPILIYNAKEEMRRDKVKQFNEIACMEGGLGQLKGKDVLPMILNLVGKAHKYGS